MQAGIFSLTAFVKIYSFFVTLEMPHFEIIAWICKATSVCKNIA